MSSSARHSVSVAAIIVDDAGQVLMTQRRDNGHWEPPGGVLELDESILDGVRREVREETGLHIEPERLSGIYKNMPRGIIALVFRARLVGGSLANATAEARRLEWLGPEEIAARCDEAYAVRVLDALSGTSTAIRSHDGIRLLRDLAALSS
jgi:8-oxo-dGTP pyrophosphatase MutT (NUDIX family)